LTIEKTEKGEALLSVLKTISPNTEHPELLVSGMNAYVSGSGRGSIRMAPPGSDLGKGGGQSRSPLPVGYFQNINIIHNIIK